MFNVIKATDEEVITHMNDLIESLSKLGVLICKEKESNSVEERQKLSKTIHIEYKELKNQIKAEYKECKAFEDWDLSEAKKNYIWAIKEAAIDGLNSKVNASCITYESIYNAIFPLKYYM